MNEVILTVIAILKGSWRYRWIALLLAYAVCSVGWVAVYAFPDTYESSATVYVNTTSALEPLLDKMTVNTDVLTRVEMVTTAMLGRPQLEKVARQTDLHLRADSDSGMDALISKMRRDVSISSTRRDPNLYTIRYRDEEPVTTQAVVTTLLDTFVEDSLGENREDTKVAQAFLRQQLDELDTELGAAEQALAEFKRQNVGRMPGESGDYFARLQSEMESLEETRSTLRLAERRRGALQQQIAGESPTLSSGTGPTPQLDARIAENETRLEELQLRFTDRHPDVIAIQQTLAQLREQKSAALEAVSAGHDAGVASDNPVFQNIQIELTKVNVEIASLLEEQATHERKINDLRALIDVIPQVEAELARLTRDYDVKQAQYKSLLERLEMAELSESAEQSKDVKFRIIDPPFLPEAPVAPNRPLIIAGILIAGLAIGAGCAFLLDQINPVFNSSLQLQQLAGLPVLGAVQTMRTKERRRWRRSQLISFFACVSGLVFIFAVVLLLHEPGSDFVQAWI